ncbi:MAG TPA: hypothetical protein VHC43_03690 [Mycobacteriales bacterium]|nr:hypothetical protein [Mycobacteriales bacterium]
MSDLLLDLPKLQIAYSELTQIKGAFDGAKSVSHELSGAVGNCDPTQWLASQISAFAEDWDIRRHKISDAMDAIAASVKAIHDTFQELDGELASALTQGG